MRDLRIVLRHLGRSPAYSLSVIVDARARHRRQQRDLQRRARGAAAAAAACRAERTVVAWQTDNVTGQAVIEMTYRHLREWRAAGQTFTHSALVGIHTWNAVLEGRGEPTRLTSPALSADFFDAMGVAPILAAGSRPTTTCRTCAAVVPQLRRVGPALRRRSRDRRSVAPARRRAGPGRRHHAARVRLSARRRILAARDAVSHRRRTEAQPHGPRHLGVFYIVGRVRPGSTRQPPRAKSTTLEKRLDARAARPAEVGRPRGRRVVPGATSSAPCSRRCGRSGRLSPCCC